MQAQKEQSQEVQGKNIEVFWQIFRYISEHVSNFMNSDSSVFKFLQLIWGLICYSSMDNQSSQHLPAGHTAFELGTPLKNLRSSYYLLPKHYLQYFNAFKAFVFFLSLPSSTDAKITNWKTYTFTSQENYSTITSATALCQAGKDSADSTLLYS